MIERYVAGTDIKIDENELVITAVANHMTLSFDNTTRAWGIVNYFIDNNLNKELDIYIMSMVTALAMINVPEFMPVLWDFADKVADSKQINISDEEDKEILDELREVENAKDILRKA